MARVLLAESDRRVRGLIAGILTDLGHEVRECADCAQANALLPMLAVDVLISDLLLHDGEGARLAHTSLSGGIPAVTLSGAPVAAGTPGAPASLPLLERPFRLADLQQIAATVAACVAAPARKAA
jgi:DNA-binding NtrC family response regulator